MKVINADGRGYAEVKVEGRDGTTWRRILDVDAGRRRVLVQMDSCPEWADVAEGVTAVF